LQSAIASQFNGTSSFSSSIDFLSRFLLSTPTRIEFLPQEVLSTEGTPHLTGLIFIPEALIRCAEERYALSAVRIEETAEHSRQGAHLS